MRLCVISKYSISLFGLLRENCIRKPILSNYQIIQHSSFFKLSLARISKL